MTKLYLLTGAAGFLGSHICDTLLDRGDKVRALVLPGDKSVKYVPKQVEIMEGDLCDIESLEKFFTVPKGTKTIAIHCASMVTVNPEYNQKLLDINVGGTKNMIEVCLRHAECEKMVYVSGTGAIPELPKRQRICEVNHFDKEDERIVGWYSKSKAIATQEVLDAVRDRGLCASIVFPSGIMGPKDFALGQTTRVMIQIMKGEMPIGMGGSFNLCDVRDLANGCVAAADKGKNGACYILANDEITLKEFCEVIKDNAPESKPPKIFIPVGIAYKIAEFMEKRAKKTGKQPIMTTFAVYNLARNNSFDYTLAKKDLGYVTRPCTDTIRDEVNWLKSEKLV